jgi:hypothetical protein
MFNSCDADANQDASVAQLMVDESSIPLHVFEVT